MELSFKGGLVSIGLVALSGYVLYLKGKNDAYRDLRGESVKRKSKKFHDEQSNDL